MVPPWQYRHFFHCKRIKEFTFEIISKKKQPAPSSRVASPLSITVWLSPFYFWDADRHSIIFGWMEGMLFDLIKHMYNITIKFYYFLFRQEPGLLKQLIQFISRCQSRSTFSVCPSMKAPKMQKKICQISETSTWDFTRYYEYFAIQCRYQNKRHF